MVPIGNSGWPSRDHVAPSSPSGADKVALGDPELEVLTVLGLPPVDERLGVIGEPVDPVAEVEDADAVDPTAEVGRRRDVGADRHDMLGDVGRVVSEVHEEATERLLGRGKAARARDRIL